MIERKMSGSPSNQELIDKVDRELALGKECLENIAKHQGCRGNVTQITFIDDSPFQRDQYVNETPYSFSQLRHGYKGGNVPNLFKSMEPCSKVNPKDVAKRRAKNKVTRKTKRK